MTAEAPAAADVAAPPATRRERAPTAVIAVVVTAVLVVLLVVMGARLEAATFALLLAAGALGLCLRALYRLVDTLARPGIEALIVREGAVESAGERALRDERRRLLRAINELRFDHDMGKLSDEDYRSVREAYELRAVEVMRALEAEPELHPRVREALEERDPASVSPTDVLEAPSVAAPEARVDAITVRTCPACDQKNDLDARFCKSCGEALVS